jgi:hypothetical protein
MRNLDQIRASAADALCRQGRFTRNDVASFPALILSNGLLSACAYALEPGRAAREALSHAVDGLALHLSQECHGIAILRGVRTGQDLLQRLSAEGTSLDLQRATREALAFFGYLKRFSQPS